MEAFAGAKPSTRLRRCGAERSGEEFCNFARFGWVLLMYEKATCLRVRFGFHVAHRGSAGPGEGGWVCRFREDARFLCGKGDCGDQCWESDLRDFSQAI